MGVASLVLGIIGLLLSFIPVVGFFGVVLAIIGLVLGIVDLVKKKKAEEKYGKALAGIICSGIAIVIVILYTVLFGAFVGKVVENVDEESVHKFINTVKELDENDEINFTFEDFEFDTVDM